VTAPSYLNWLVDTGERQATACGREIEIWELNPQDDAEILSNWARHFRNHYIADADLPFMAGGTGLGHPDYLRTILFPDAKVAPGPSLRSGDFGEIVVADFIEYFLGYWCPRELSYQDRWNRNDSTKGCDVIGFKFANEDNPGPADELFIFESKSGMSASGANRLQDAIDGASVRSRVSKPNFVVIGDASTKRGNSPSVFSAAKTCPRGIEMHGGCFSIQLLIAVLKLSLLASLGLEHPLSRIEPLATSSANRFTFNSL